MFGIKLKVTYKHLILKISQNSMYVIKNFLGEKMTVDDLIIEKIGDGLIRNGAMNRQSVHRVLIYQACGDKRCFGEIASALKLVAEEEINLYMNLKHTVSCPGYDKKRVFD